MKACELDQEMIAKLTVDNCVSGGPAALSNLLRGIVHQKKLSQLALKRLHIDLDCMDSIV